MDDTPDCLGQPRDLLGTWDYRTVTPLERQANLTDKEFLTESEVASFEQLASEMGITLDKDKREGLSAQEDLTYAYNDFWWNWGTKIADGARTSLIVVPTDGRVPPLTQAAKEKAAFRRAAWGTSRSRRFVGGRRPELRPTDADERLQQQRADLPNA